MALNKEWVEVEGDLRGSDFRRKGPDTSADTCKQHCKNPGAWLGWGTFTLKPNQGEETKQIGTQHPAAWSAGGVSARHQLGEPSSVEKALEVRGCCSGPEPQLELQRQFGWLLCQRYPW